ncbi:MAG: aldehyde dehydrogenase family protein [Gammaproteobacteria bacterium]
MPSTRWSTPSTRSATVSPLACTAASRRARRRLRRARVGNVYINRDMVGAVVGMQPFGGMGLSGTGPKAGGPHYLGRFVVEQVVSENTAAIGGNAALLGGRT